MDKVYSNCFCNIYASSGCPDRGLFAERHHQALSMARYAISVSDATRRSVRCQYELLNTAFWEIRGPESLMRRGWVFQEWLLAPRIIHFGIRELSWECHNSMVTKVGHFARKSGERSPKDLLGLARVASTQKDLEGVFHCWAKMLVAYTVCDLTRPNDRLIALSGVANKMSELLDENDTYLAGLWLSCLPFLLTWRIERWLERQLGDQPEGFQDADYMLGFGGPSWSWASVTNQISYLRSTHERSCIKVLDADTTLKSNNRTGGVSDGYIKLRGLLTTHLTVRHTIIAWASIHLECREEKGMRFKHSKWNPDTPSRITKNCEVICLPIARGDIVSRLRGITLVDSERGDGSYKRNGAFLIQFITEAHVEDFLSGGKKTELTLV